MEDSGLGSDIQPMSASSSESEKSVNFLNHCMFCLRKLLEDDPVNPVGTWNSCGVSKFKTSTWINHVSATCLRESLDLPLQEFLKAWRYIFSAAGVSSFKIEDDLDKITEHFCKTPPMCFSCGQLVEQISASGAFNGICSMANTLQSIITESGKNGMYASERYQKFLNVLMESEIEEDSRLNTIKFLDEMGHGKEKIVQRLQGNNWNGSVALADGAVKVAEHGIIITFNENGACFFQGNTGRLLANVNWSGARGIPIAILIRSSISSMDPEVNVQPQAQSQQPLIARANQPDDCNRQGVLGSFETSKNGSTELIDEVYTSLASVLPLSNIQPVKNDVSNFLNSNLLNDMNRQNPESDIEKKTVICSVSTNSPKPTFFRKPQMCDICAKPVTYDKMLNHMETHVGNLVVSCPNPHCSLIFSSRNDAYYTHLRRKKCRSFCEQNPEKFVDLKTCDICNFRTDTLKGLRSHLQWKHETESKTISCPILPCSAAFTVRQSLEQHIAQQHSTFREKRKMITPPKKALLEDGKPGSKVNDKDFQCPHCDRTYDARDKFLKHLRFHIKKGLAVSCDLCDKTCTQIWFKQYAQLLKHQFVAHNIDTKERTVCQYCKKSYFNRATFKHHVKLHQRKEAVAGSKEEEEPGKIQSNYGNAMPEQLTTQVYAAPSLSEHTQLEPHAQNALQKYFKDQAATRFDAQFAPSELVCMGPAPQYCTESGPSEYVLKQPAIQFVAEVHEHPGMQYHTERGPSYHGLKESSMPFVIGNAINPSFEPCQELRSMTFNDPCVFSNHNTQEPLFKQYDADHEPISGNQIHTQEMKQQSDNDNYILNLNPISVQKSSTGNNLKTQTNHCLLCDQCGKEFDSSKTLKAHTRAVHAQSKAKAVCMECQKSFPNENALREHLLIHTGEWLYSCTKCVRKFRQKKYLLMHLKSHQMDEEQRRIHVGGVKRRKKQSNPTNG